MQRRKFLGLPLAGAALGLGGMGRIAQAAVAPRSTKTPTLAATLLRLNGSTGSASDEQLIDSSWESAWSPSSGGLSRARLTLHGVVRNTGVYSAFNVESAYFGDKGALNTALVYLGGSDALGARSKAIGMDVVASSYGGLLISALSGAKTAATATCVVGDNATGKMAPGLYVVVLGSSSAQRVSAYDYQFSTYLDRPLMRRDGRLPDVDYLAFSLAKA